MSTTRTKPKGSKAAVNAAKATDTPLQDTTNVPAPNKRAQANSRAKKFTQADIDALNAQWEADLAKAQEQAQSEHDAEVADYQRRLANAQQAADEATEAAARDSSTDDTIPRPAGSAGRSFRLIDAMRLTNNKLEYDLIRRKVHVMCSRVKLPMDVTFRKQADRKVVHLCDKMRDECPYLRRFIGDWATKELARAYLKHVRAYEKKKRAAMLARRALAQHADDDNAGSGAEA